MSYRFVDSFRAGPGWNCGYPLVLLESCLQTCMTYTIAECTVNNSWWWTEELPETCRVSWQNKFVKLVHLVGFIIKKFVTMHCRSHERKITCVNSCYLQFSIYITYTNCAHIFTSHTPIVRTYLHHIHQLCAHIYITYTNCAHIFTSHTPTVRTYLHHIHQLCAHICYEPHNIHNFRD
jgi:hypothetical protein